MPIDAINIMQTDLAAIMPIFIVFGVIAIGVSVFLGNAHIFPLGLMMILGGALCSGSMEMSNFLFNNGDTLSHVARTAVVDPTGIYSEFITKGSF